MRNRFPEFPEIGKFREANFLKPAENKRYPAGTQRAVIEARVLLQSSVNILGGDHENRNSVSRQ
jgi:hypothetical protein